MLEDPRSPTDPGEPSRDLLTPEELRELLSPLEGIQDNDGDPVLLLTHRPEDVEAVSVFLTRHGVRVVPARNRYAALDLFRKREYSAHPMSDSSGLLLPAMDQRRSIALWTERL